MIACLSAILLTLTTLLGAVTGCSNGTVANGRLIDFSGTAKEGDRVTVECDTGYSTYTTQVQCTGDGSWSNEPICHKVYVWFEETSMIRYLYPIPRDSSSGEITFSFSVPPKQSSGVLVRLSSKKQADGTRDTLTIELVGGFLATTMQFNRVSQKLIGFCHDNVRLNDELVHSVRLVRRPRDLTLQIDGRNIDCTTPQTMESNFTFTELRSITVGHLQPSWGANYGMTGCMTNLNVDGIAPLILADLAVNAGGSSVTAENVKFMETCGTEFVVPTEPPVKPSTESPFIPEIVTGKVEEENGNDDDDDGGSKSTIIIIIVTICILIILVLVIGIVCKRYYSNKGTYRVDNDRARAPPDQGEQEYFI